MLDREYLGKIVREVRIECEHLLANPDPSRLVPWEELNGWEKEIDRKIGERIAQSVLSENNYALSLAGVHKEQIIYNGKFSYLRQRYTPSALGWCHLLVLRSKNTYSKQLLAIVTQTPDSDVSIVNAIEEVATFVVNFFSSIYITVLGGDGGGSGMTPENTTFIEYLPAGCFGPQSGHNADTLDVMEFEWEEVHISEFTSYHRAKNPEWHGTSRDTINDLIERL
jgi:hypothetical protein